MDIDPVEALTAAANASAGVHSNAANLQAIITQLVAENRRLTALVLQAQAPAEPTDAE